MKMCDINVKCINVCDQYNQLGGTGFTTFFDPRVQILLPVFFVAIIARFLMSEFQVRTQQKEMRSKMINMNIEYMW